MSTSRIQHTPPAEHAIVQNRDRPSPHELRVLECALARLSPHPERLARDQAYNSLSCNGTLRLEKMRGEGAAGVVLTVSDKALPNYKFAIKIAKSPLWKNSFWQEHLALHAASIYSPSHTIQACQFQVNTLGGPEECASCCNQRAMIISVDGGDNLFRKYVITNPKLSLPLFTQIVRECLEFLQETWDTGYVVGDIKPDNIVSDENHHIRFLDFNERYPVGTKLPYHRGSVWYNSPQLLLHTLDKSEQLFGIGCVLVEILISRPLFFTDLPKELTSLERLQIHLSQVFLLMPSSWDFVQRVPEHLRKKLFVIDETTQTAQFKSVFLRGSPTTSGELLQILFEETHRALDPFSQTWRVYVPPVLQDKFKHHFFDFIHRCLNYESPPTPDELLNHPLLHLKGACSCHAHTPAD